MEYTREMALKVGSLLPTADIVESRWTDWKDDVWWLIIVPRAVDESIPAPYAVHLYSTEDGAEPNWGGVSPTETYFVDETGEEWEDEDDTRTWADAELWEGADEDIAD